MRPWSTNRSFAGAARQLQLPASNVSRHVAALERSLGVRLLERSTRHLRMTEAGRLLYQRAKPLLDTLAATAEELGAGEQQALRAAAHAHARRSPLLLGPIIAEFCASHPGVELQCDTRMAGEQALRGHGPGHRVPSRRPGRQHAGHARTGQPAQPGRGRAG